MTVMIIQNVSSVLLNLLFGMIYFLFVYNTFVHAPNHALSWILRICLVMMTAQLETMCINRTYLTICLSVYTIQETMLPLSRVSLGLVIATFHIHRVYLYCAFFVGAVSHVLKAEVRNSWSRARGNRFSWVFFCLCVCQSVDYSIFWPIFFSLSLGVWK